MSDFHTSSHGVSQVPLPLPYQTNRHSSNATTIWKEFGELLVRKARQSVRGAANGSSGDESRLLNSVEETGLALASQELDAVSNHKSRPDIQIQPKTQPSNKETDAQREVERLRREQMDTVRCLLEAEANRESMIDTLRRHEAQVAAENLDGQIVDATLALRDRLETAPRDVRDITAAVERKEAQLRQILLATNQLSVFEGEARRCAAEYEEQMDRIVRRAADGVAAVAANNALVRAQRARIPRGTNAATQLSYIRSGDGAGLDPSKGRDNPIEENGTSGIEDLLSLETEDRLREFADTLASDRDSEQAHGQLQKGVASAPHGGLDLQHGERASLLQRFDRMMRLFATSCAMEARKIIKESQEAKDREHQQALGAIMVDVRREHIREIDQVCCDFHTSPLYSPLVLLTVASEPQCFCVLYP